MMLDHRTKEDIGLRCWFLVSLAVIILTLSSVFYIDQAIAWWMREHITGWVLALFKLISLLGYGGLYLGLSALAFCVFLILRRKDMMIKSAFVFLSVIISGAAVDLLKIIIARARPSVLFRQGLYGAHPFHYQADWNSFPSGHSQTIWAALYAVYLFKPQLRLLCFTVIALVCSSRILICAHFLSDVIFGSWLGVTGVWGLRFYFKRWGYDVIR